MLAGLWYPGPMSDDDLPTPADLLETYDRIAKAAEEAESLGLSGKAVRALFKDWQRCAEPFADQGAAGGSEAGVAAGGATRRLPNHPHRGDNILHSSEGADRSGEALRHPGSVCRMTKPSVVAP